MIAHSLSAVPLSLAPFGPNNVSPDAVLMDGINEAAEGMKVSCSAEEPSDDPGMDDLALVAAVLRKDRKATAEFVGTYTDAVYSFIRRRLNPREDLVDDLVQDVFIAAWENLPRFRGSSSLRGWLLGIARHKVEDHYRRLLQDAHPLDAELAEVLPDTRLDAEAAVDLERLEQQTRKVLNEMPQHYSVALLWRYWERRSARDVAQATGRSEKAVERLLARAREQFRRRWQNV
jgi:RNA polymerase sigma-70 factor (ECF subfamily)